VPPVAGSVELRGAEGLAWGNIPGAGKRSRRRGTPSSRYPKIKAMGTGPRPRTGNTQPVEVAALKGLARRRGIEEKFLKGQLWEKLDLL